MLSYREGYTPILELLQSQAIPLLVFSAGVGDIIEQCFVQRYKLYNNIHIIANWMSFSHEVMIDGINNDNNNNSLCQPLNSSCPLEYVDIIKSIPESLMTSLLNFASLCWMKHICWVLSTLTQSPTPWSYLLSPI